MIRTLITAALFLAVAAPAAAQSTAAPPPTTGTIVVQAPAAPASAPSPGPTYASPTPSAERGSASAVTIPPGYLAFPPRDRQGRVLVGTRHEMQNDRGLWGAGLGLFLAGWVLDMAGTGIANAMSTDRTDADEQDAQAWSILPFAGPIIQLAIEAPHPAIPITSGLLQITGLVMFVLGMTSQHDAEVPIYAWGPTADARTPRLGLEVAPTQGGAMGTLSLHL